jgi:hypothetical protein
MAEHEVLVPLSEMGYANADREVAEAFATLFDVEIQWDYNDRACVDLDTAYLLGARRRQLEREFAEEQVRREQAAQQAIRDLERDLERVFKEAHAAALRDAPKGRDPSAHAINAGLQAARLRWFAADLNTRQQVRAVDVEHEDGSASSYDLGMITPHGSVEAGIKHAVEKANAVVLMPREAAALASALSE